MVNNNNDDENRKDNEEEIHNDKPPMVQASSSSSSAQLVRSAGIISSLINTIKALRQSQKTGGLDKKQTQRLQKLTLALLDDLKESLSNSQDLTKRLRALIQDIMSGQLTPSKARSKYKAIMKEYTRCNKVCAELSKRFLTISEGFDAFSAEANLLLEDCQTILHPKQLTEYTEKNKKVVVAIAKITRPLFNFLKFKDPVLIENEKMKKVITAKVQHLNSVCIAYKDVVASCKSSLQDLKKSLDCFNALNTSLDQIILKKSNAKIIEVKQRQSISMESEEFSIMEVSTPDSIDMGATDIEVSAPASIEMGATDSYYDNYTTAESSDEEDNAESPTLQI